MADWFNVESWRSRVERTVAVRHPTERAIVLGSSQSESVVDREAARLAETAILRRRSGGGAVLVGPGDPLWLDVWLPRGDPLWEDDVVAGSFWIGDWWAGALQATGIARPMVRRGPSMPNPWSAVVCFAGLGPGEVAVEGRKVVGVCQWRSRQGALFQSCAYRRWDGAAIVHLLAGRPDERAQMGAALERQAAGLEHLGAHDGAELESALLARLPSGRPWRILPA